MSDYKFISFHEEGHIYFMILAEVKDIRLNVDDGVMFYAFRVEFLIVIFDLFTLKNEPVAFRELQYGFL